MANNKANASIQQHEPLRTPESFDAQGKQLVQRLQDIFDDIYKRFGRLSMKDLGLELREDIAHVITVGEEVEELDGRVTKNETAITQLPDTIQATVNENGVQTSSVKLDKTGVAVQSRGNFTVDAGGYVGVNAVNVAGSYINLGDTFSANAITGVQAKQAMFGTLYVGGREVKPSDNIDIKVATSQPSGSNLLWVKPIASGGESKEVSYNTSISSRGTSEMLTSGATRNHTMLGTDTQDSGAQSYKYGVSFFITNIGSGSASATLSISLTNGYSSVALGTVSTGSVAQWGVKSISVETTSLTNVCTGGSLTLSVRVVSGGSSNLFIERDQVITAKCRSTFAGSTGVMPCEVYWIT